MPTATYPPRCLNRGANKTSARWSTVVVLALLASTTAPASLVGQDIELRFVEPAGHVQLWPVDEVEVSPQPAPDPGPVWKIALAPPSKPATKNPTAAAKLPAPVSAPPVEDSEVLGVPPTEVVNDVWPKPMPVTQAIECYQAPELASMSFNIGLPSGKLPTNAAALCRAEHPPSVDPRAMGAWANTGLHWSATGMRHRPLYFEEINAERYGYTVSYCLQPAISAAKFFATIPALPYLMAADHPRDCSYTLGHYRPGSCAPRCRNRLPRKLTASAVEVGTIAGLILLIP